MAESKRLIITGRVQGVGYRDWAARTARSLGLVGYVRNRRDGSVELLVHGDTIAEMIRACHRGPPLANVTDIIEETAQPPDGDGFELWPTV